MSPVRHSDAGGGDPKAATAGLARVF